MSGMETRKVTETDLLTSIECAEYRRCSVRKLDRERAEGVGPAYVRIGSRIFYRRRDVDRFISAHVCGGELHDVDAAAEPTPHRRGRPRKPLADEVRS
jgi:hypothetical protein